MRNISYTSRFTRLLTKRRVFKDSPLCVLDVGARGGPQSHWPLYDRDINVIGFEPHAEECKRLNGIASSFNVPFTCYPVGLGREEFTARLYEYPNKAANSLIPPQGVENPAYTDIHVTRFDRFAAQHNISKVDFAKLDVERHEMEALEGMEAWLGGDNPIFGLEIEVHFKPDGDTPLFSDIELYLRRHGYRVADLDIFKASSNAMPAPVAWDHRNHLNEPILGPTTTGEMIHGDALFFLDLSRVNPEWMRAKGPLYILKCASLFEVYGLPDCAAELLLQYSGEVEQVISVDEALNALVPDHFGQGLTYQQYLKTYQERVGRPVTPEAPAAASQTGEKSSIAKVFRLIKGAA